MFIKSDNTF